MEKITTNNSIDSAEREGLGGGVSLAQPLKADGVPGTGRHRRTEQHVIDAEMNVEIFRTAGSPNYYVQYNDPIAGQQKRSLKTNKKKTAESKARNIAAELRTGKDPGHKRRDLTIQQGIDLYTDWLVRKERDQKTLKIHRSFFGQFAHWCKINGIRTVSQLSDKVLERIEDTFRGTGFMAPPPAGSPAKKARPNGKRTVRGKMRIILAMIKRAMRRKRLGELPYIDYQPPAGRSEEGVEVFTPSEIQLLRDDPDLEMRDVWRMFLFTGARSSELCRWLKSDVSTDQWGLWVRAKECPLTGLQWFPKKKRERFIPIVDASAIEHVREVLAKAKGPYLFTGPGGVRWKPDTLRSRLRGRLTALGIGHGRIHTFRHTVADFLANDPAMTLVHVKEFLGHADIQTTMIYIHTKAKDVQHALKGVDFGRLSVPMAATLATTSATTTTNSQDPK